MEMNLLLISSSKSNHGNYLAHAYTQIEELLEGVDEVTFVPYARPGGISHDDYTQIASEGFQPLGKKVRGVHTFENHADGVAQAQAIFIGGGNTFLLLQQLYTHGLIKAISQRARGGMPYMGTSAGSNVAGKSICTTNDMPIVYPPSFDAMGLVPFNINPHFPAVKKDANHMGESREDRIHEFLHVNTTPVVAIREDSMLWLRGNSLKHHGPSPGIVFEQGKPDTVIDPGADLSFLV